MDLGLHYKVPPASVSCLIPMERARGKVVSSLATIAVIAGKSLITKM